MQLGPWPYHVTFDNASMLFGMLPWFSGGIPGSKSNIPNMSKTGLAGICEMMLTFLSKIGDEAEER